MRRKNNLFRLSYKNPRSAMPDGDFYFADVWDINVRNMDVCDTDACDMDVCDTDVCDTDVCDTSLLDVRGQAHVDAGAFLLGGGVEGTAPGVIFLRGVGFGDLEYTHVCTLEVT